MPRRILEGEVVSDKMDKTVTVLVQRRYMHPVYKKYIRKSDKFAAHDETNRCKVGDKVQIIECRPISKRKSWLVITDGQTDLPERRKKFTTQDAGKQAARKTPTQRATEDKEKAAKAPVKKETAPKAARKTTKGKKD